MSPHLFTIYSFINVYIEVPPMTSLKWLVPVIILEYVLTPVISLKNPCFYRGHATFYSDLYDCLLLETLCECVFLINSAISHVESDLNCERTAYAMTTIFCMNDAFNVTSCLVSHLYCAIFRNH